MNLLALAALLTALASSTSAITKIIEDLRAAGHPETAPLPPATMDAIHAALTSAGNIPDETLIAAGAAADAIDSWAVNHASGA